MTPADISDLLTRLGIFPKRMPRTLERAVKLIERQRWEKIVAENEGSALVAVGWGNQNAHKELNAVHIGEKIAAAIRARVK